MKAKKTTFGFRGTIPWDASMGIYVCSKCGQNSFRALGTAPSYCRYCDRKEIGSRKGNHS